MNLSTCIASLLQTPSLSSMVTAACALPIPTANRDEAKTLYEQLPRRIAADDRRYAVASTLVLLRIDGSKWISRMRKDGLFRASRYGFNDGCLKKIVAAAHEMSVVAKLPSEQILYLESVQALLGLAGPAKQIHRSIVKRLKNSKGAALKTLLAIVNFSFSMNWMGDDQVDKSQPQHWSATDLASAFSRLYSISRNNLGICTKTWRWTDDLAASVHEGVYSSLLTDALRINEFIDAEVLLDGLPYKAHTTPFGVMVSSIDPEFEKSVRLGYIQSELQANVRAVSTLKYLGGDQPKLASFEEAIIGFIVGGLLDCVSLKDEPYERFVIALPNIPSLIDLLNFNGSFLEEVPIVLGALDENFQPSFSTALKVSAHLSILDLLKAQRLFKLIDTIFFKKLETVEDAVKRRILTLRSTVIVISSAELMKMLQLVMSPDKVQELFSLLSLPTSDSTMGSEVYIDLQYRPFIHSMSTQGNDIAIAPAIVGKSNLVRSIMHASRIKKATAAADDPAQIAVAAALREAGFLVSESFDFNINGKRETDIFCYLDGVLFVFECKNAYHPCSPHELRNSYDLVLKAEEQLDIRAKWLAEPSNQMRLFKAMGWEVAEPARVGTCIVTANRAFNGYRCGTHPVRQAHELINVLARGFVGSVNGEPLSRFWRSEKFEVTDLLDYLDGISVLQTQHAAMAPWIKCITLKGRRLEFAQFKMDLQEMHSSLSEFSDA